MHPSILDTFRGVDLLTAGDVQGRRVLEVGSADVNGTVRPIIEAYGPVSYLGIDGGPGKGVDRVLDAGELAATFGEQAFDVIISTEMLEHAANWRRVLANMTFVLAEGGLLVVTTRSPGFPYHAFPDDYWRYTQEQMRGILAALGLTVELVIDDPDPDSPGVIARARKPVGWDLPDEKALLDPAIQPDRAPNRPLSILGYPHDADGSGYYRFYLPYKLLARATPHRVMLPQQGQHPVVNDDDLPQVDAIVGQRFMGPGLDLWKHWEGKTKLVYETDDNIFDPDPSSGLAHLHAPEVQATARQCVAMADMVTVSTEPLAEVMRHYNPNVAVIPNCIHGDLLTLERRRRERLTIGWAGGMSHLADWVTAADPLADILAANPDVDMHFVGITYAPLLRRPCRYTPWQHDVWDYFQAIDFDIALCPLEDTPFNRCKSHLKALEAMALGIPVVAADQPSYRDLVVDGVTGFLVRNEAEWSARLNDLVHDDVLRKEMGEAGRKVAAGWTIQANWQRWRDAYEQVCGWSE